MAAGPASNKMGRSLSYSPEREIYLGFVAMPICIGRQQRTSKSRRLMHIVVYLATFASRALTWTRRGTHTAGNYRQLPCRNTYTHFSTLAARCLPLVAREQGALVRNLPIRHGPHTTVDNRLGTHLVAAPMHPRGRNSLSRAMLYTHYLFYNITCNKDRPDVKKKRPPAPYRSTPYGLESAPPLTRGTKPAETPWHSPIGNKVKYIINRHHIASIWKGAAAACLKLTSKIVAQARLKYAVRRSTVVSKKRSTASSAVTFPHRRLESHIIYNILTLHNAKKTTYHRLLEEVESPQFDMKNGTMAESCTAIDNLTHHRPSTTLARRYIPLNKTVP
jgi:hypothetical protein